MNEHFVDPAVLSSIAHLELIARQAVEGTVSGLHHSHYLGRNVEFSEHRPYNPGDELRHIDWRVFAKTDRFHIKLFEEDTNLRALILTDLSASMNFKDSTLSKADYARRLAATLSYLMLGQGDSVGLAVFDREVRSFIPPGARSDQWSALIEALAKTKLNQDESNIADILSGMGEHLKKRGMVILISDLIDDPSVVLNSLALLRKRHQEILVFHLLAPEEVNLPYHGMVEFHPLEGAQESLLTAPKRLLKSYRRRIVEFLDAYKNGCMELDIDYQFISTDRPLEEVLRKYLQRRMKTSMSV